MTTKKTIQLYENHYNINNTLQNINSVDTNIDIEYGVYLHH